MKMLTVVGARPQFIKAAAISRVIRDHYTNSIEEVIVHTGQHHDENMSQIFFDELDIPKPKFNLEISGGGHGAMTGKMIEGIEQVLLQEKPDWLLVYGDTNSTLAGALAASKLHIPVAHVEAGLRSFNMRMPEEVNRIVADRISTLLFCPTDTAVQNLKREGVSDGVHNVGDVMYDAALFYQEKANTQSNVLERLKLKPKKFALATCHRAENTDDTFKLGQILAALAEIATNCKVVLPLHPRTKKRINDLGYNDSLRSLVVTDPLPFLDMVALEQSAKIILTDSGGVQKEAFFYRVPCITMRDETEWVETVSQGCNCLTGASHKKILKAFESMMNLRFDHIQSNLYGNGDASSAICKAILVQNSIINSN
jgi:UDP-GlcNAc3NAcA epimerase